MWKVVSWLMGGMCVRGVEWVSIVVCCAAVYCVGAQVLGMCASVLGSVWLWVGACVHVFGSLFGGGRVWDEMCVHSPVTLGRGCLWGARPLMQKAFPL